MAQSVRIMAKKKIKPKKKTQCKKNCSREKVCGEPNPVIPANCSNLVSVKKSESYVSKILRFFGFSP